MGSTIKLKTWTDGGLKCCYAPILEELFQMLGWGGTYDKVTIYPIDRDYISQTELKNKLLGIDISIEPYSRVLYKITKGRNVEIACVMDKVYWGGTGVVDKRAYKYIKIGTLDLSRVIVKPLRNDSLKLSTDNMFARLDVDKLVLGDIDTSKAESMDYMFYNSNIGNINEIVGRLNTSRVKSMKHMFATSSGDTLDISRLDTRKVEDAGGMFRNCRYNTLNISGFGSGLGVGGNLRLAYNMLNTAQVNHLISNDLHWDKVSDIEQIFYNADIKSGIDISSVKPSSAINIKHSFEKLRRPSIKLSQELLDNVYNEGVLSDLDKIKLLFDKTICNEVYAGDKEYERSES